MAWGTCRQTLLQIEFDRVDFQYPGSKTKALTNFSISIPQGSRIAYSWQTASGKPASRITSSALRSQPRIYQTRRHRFKNTSSGFYSANKLLMFHRMSFLFSETIEDNIAFGIENQDPQLVRKAAEYASVAAEIEEFPDSYKSILENRA